MDKKESILAGYSYDPVLLTIVLLLILTVVNLAKAAPPAQDPLSVSATFTIEGVRKVGSAKSSPQTERRYVLSLPVEADLKSLTGFRIGSLSAQGLFINEDPDLMKGSPIVDDLHAYSNLRAENRYQLFELFWSQRWGQFSTRIGKLDANDHFAVSEHEAMLINGAAGFSPSIAGLPSYPDSAWSIQCGYTWHRVDALFGAFDGGSTSLRAVPTGQQLRLSEEALQGGLFYIAQLSFHLGELHQEDPITSPQLSSPQQDRNFTAKAPYHITIGIWTHRGAVVPNLEDDQDNDGQPTSGLYLTSDVTLARFKGASELGLGFQAAISQHDPPLHLSSALTWSEFMSPLAWSETGPSLAMGISHISSAASLSKIGSQYASSEQLFELTLATPLLPSFMTSLSWITLRGKLLPKRVVNLLIARAVLGTL